MSLSPLGWEIVEFGANEQPINKMPKIVTVCLLCIAGGSKCGGVYPGGFWC